MPIVIVSLDRLTDPEIQRGISRAIAIAPAVTVTERGDGFVRGEVACNGGCGARAFHDNRHDVVLWWNLIATCDCPAVHGCCYHVAALWQHEGGAVPAKPLDCEAYHCGSPLMYWGDGNGHAAQCPRVDDPEDRYVAPTPDREPRPAPRTRAAKSASRQRMIERTRPTIDYDTIAETITVRRACGCEAYTLSLPQVRLADVLAPLPLSPHEGCPNPEHYDHMYPPAADQMKEETQ